MGHSTRPGSELPGRRLPEPELRRRRPAGLRGRRQEPGKHRPRRLVCLRLPPRRAARGLAGDACHAYRIPAEAARLLRRQPWARRGRRRTVPPPERPSLIVKGEKVTETTSPGTPSAGEPLAPSAEAAGATTLRRNALSMPEVLAQSVANMSPTGAMALLPLLVFVSAGNGTWLSFVIAVVLMACVGYCAAQFSRRATSAGSFYVWVTRGLGPGAGHTAGWALQLGYVATGVATILGFGIFGADFLNRVSGGAIPADNRWVLAVLFLIDFFVPLTVAILDMRLSARTSLTLEVISVALILILCVAIWVHKGGVIDSAQISFSGVSGGGVLVGVVLAIFAFVGFESAGSLGMEARNPYQAGFCKERGAAARPGQHRRAERARAHHGHCDCPEPLRVHTGLHQRLGAHRIHDGARRHGSTGAHAGPRHSPDPTHWDLGRLHPDGAGGDRASSRRDRRH